jgi:hypothetical protein
MTLGPDEDISATALSETQTDILKSYFESNILGSAKYFVTSISDQLSREHSAFILYLCCQAPCSTFNTILKEHYRPTKHSFDANKQITAISNKLLAVNMLCAGEIDFGHEIYRNTFDKRFTPTKQATWDVATKKKAVSEFFKSEVKALIKSLGIEMDRFSQDRPSTNPKIETTKAQLLTLMSPKGKDRHTDAESPRCGLSSSTQLH